MGPIYGTQLGCIPLWLRSLLGLVCGAQARTARGCIASIHLVCMSNRLRIDPAMAACGGASKDGVTKRMLTRSPGPVREIARANGSPACCTAGQSRLLLSVDLFASSTRTLTLLRHRPRENGANRFQVYSKLSLVVH